MRRLASIAVVFFIVQVLICGLHGLGASVGAGLGAERGRIADAGAGHCASGSERAPSGSSDEDESRRCREHCEQYVRALSASPPAVEAPPALMVFVLKSAPHAPPVPSAAYASRLAPIPPAAPLPILHSALLI